MKVSIITILMVLSSHWSFAQCEQFDGLIREGNQLSANNNYEAAIRKYAAALIVCPDRSQEAADKYVELFKKVKALKAEAEEAERKAREPLARIRAANAKSVKLLLYNAREKRRLLDYSKPLELLDNASDLGALEDSVASAYAEYVFIYGLMGEWEKVNAILKKAYPLIGKSAITLNKVPRNRILKTISPIVETLGGDVLEIRNRYIPAMVSVKGGAFAMGNEYGEEGDYGHPVHQVTLSDYHIGKYEVTVAQYFIFCKAVLSGYCYDERMIPQWGFEGAMPMPSLDRSIMLRYCNFLSELLGLEKVYVDGYKMGINWKANGIRLPTEAEWEYAARGGRVDKGQYKYSGSNNEEEVAAHPSSPVGSKKPNGLGIYDMSGGLGELCWDLVGKYTAVAQTNPKGPADLPIMDGYGSYEQHIVRGGIVGDRSKYGNDTYLPSNSFGAAQNVGFRVAKGQ